MREPSGLVVCTVNAGQGCNGECRVWEGFEVEVPSSAVELGMNMTFVCVLGLVGGMGWRGVFGRFQGREERW